MNSLRRTKRFCKQKKTRYFTFYFIFYQLDFSAFMLFCKCCVFPEKLGCDRLQIFCLPPRNFVLQNVWVVCVWIQNLSGKCASFASEHKFFKRMQNFSGNRNYISIILRSLIKRLCSPKKLTFKQKNCDPKALKYIFLPISYFFHHYVCSFLLRPSLSFRCSSYFSKCRHISYFSV